MQGLLLTVWRRGRGGRSPDWTLTAKLGIRNREGVPEMTEVNDDLTGDVSLYRLIAIILTVIFLVNGLALLALNVDSIESGLNDKMGSVRAFMIQLFFWGTSGATIAASLFMANDKQQNINARLTANPDPLELQYPDKIDVWLYVQRIVSSGFLAVFGAAILFAGLGYFDVSIEALTAKHRIFLVVFGFTIGLYENRFLRSLDKMSKTLFSKHAGVTEK